MTTPPDAPLAPPARAPRPFAGVALGAALGALATAIVGAVLVVKTRQHPPEPPASYVATKDTVKLTSAAVPMRFGTALVELGPPLPHVPVTARVLTAEALTGPSFAPLDGRVVEVAVKIGDQVKEGDRLVMVSSGDLATMARELGAARLTIKTKESLVERLKQLVASRAASENDLLVAESELNEARLTATSANARIRSLSVRQVGESGFWILAARTGTVVQLDAVRGKQVGPDKDKPVATVANLDEVLVVSDVPVHAAALLSVGTQALITQPGVGAEPIVGAVEVVSAVLDPERQTVPIRVRVKNTNRALRPGQYVEATFAPNGSDRLLQLPSEAVVTDGSESVVFVETEPGTFQRRLVRVGRQTRERAEILSGVAAGERVVVRGALLLLNAIDVKG
ncbi:MAG TPA: efflux RND transporter periplasmic adaptor subunit [Polyangiaceae bacterium]|nr:efflux RND transporter periplasmic adaptor subunit [Polyangiaceae bacterium]